MKKILATCQMLAFFLLPVAALGDTPFVRLYEQAVVGHVGHQTFVRAECLAWRSITPENDTFTLRDEQGRILCTREWTDPAQLLTFRFQVEGWMTGGHALSIWRGKEQISTGSCYAAFSDLGVKRITRLEPAEPAIALTIVCGGGSYKQMDDILAVLDKYGVKATFFLSGGYLTAMPEDARRIVTHGHEVGSHGNMHIHMAQIQDYTALRANITALNRACEEVLGVRPRLFRAPFSETNEKITALCRAEGMEDVMWNIDSKDWADENRGKPRAIIRRVTGDQAVSGSIIQFHLDGHHTAEVLDAVIPIYQQEYGYRVVTVTELMALSGRELPPLPFQE